LAKRDDREDDEHFEGPECGVRESSGRHHSQGSKLHAAASQRSISFGLQLTDSLYSKVELLTSLWFSSKKSDKHALDREHVAKMLSLIDRQFGQDWDLRIFTAKANQKCHDART